MSTARFGTLWAQRIALLLVLPMVCAASALVSCAPPPLRKVAHLDPSKPMGRIEGGKFIGEQIPIEISTAGTGWEISTTYPKFLLEQGYEEGGLEQSQVFLFNPKTRSSIQIELSPAGAHEPFSQERIEWLTSIMKGGMEHELEDEYGAGNFQVVHGEVKPYRLQGVPYAAKAFSRYEAKADKRENGWIYAFAEPFQIFVLYQLEDAAAVQDAQAVDKILSTFRCTSGDAKRK